MNSNFPNQEPFDPSNQPFHPTGNIPLEAGGFQQQQLADQEPKGNGIATGLSWIVILCIAFGLFYVTASKQLEGPAETGDTSGAELMQINLQAKYLVGVNQLFGMQGGQPNGGKKNQNGPADQLLDGASSIFEMGPPEQRWAGAIIINDLVGAEKAIQQMSDTEQVILRNEYPLSDRQKRIRQIVYDTLNQYASDEFDSHKNLPVEDREFIQDELGFVGKLVLYPSESPHVKERKAIESSSFLTICVIIGVVILGGLMAIVGLITMFIFFVQTVNGNIRTQFRITNRGGIYAETFAIWMVVFIGMQMGLGFLAAENMVSNLALRGIMLLLFFGSLIVLIWPILRGIDFETVCSDIGWKFRAPLKDGLYGGLTYIATIPLLVLGFVAMIAILMTMVNFMPPSGELASQGGAGHPVQEQMANGGSIEWIFIVLTLCVAAPVVEETMFRGVLYRHLRDMSGRRFLVMSIVFSAFVNGLLFAMIHPQGMFGIPLLTLLALGFSFAREWRDSLVAPMVMHAINNGMVACLMFCIM